MKQPPTVCDVITVGFREQRTLINEGSKGSTVGLSSYFPWHFFVISFWPVQGYRRLQVCETS